MTTPSAPRISEDELARLEELAAKATPGPWRAMSVSDQNNRWTVGPFGAFGSLFVGSRVGAEDDAFFIAAANPDTIRRLIVAVRLAARSAPAAGLREALHELYDEVDTICDENGQDAIRLSDLAAVIAAQLLAAEEVR